uniref:LIM zinc-binding domain-containing protein n=1 Tax=Callorhinchus milii TaxID=7868 RepID=A0A4W3J992_CALMI
GRQKDLQASQSASQNIHGSDGCGSTWRYIKRQRIKRSKVVCSLLIPCVPFICRFFAPSSSSPLPPPPPPPPPVNEWNALQPGELPLPPPPSPYRREVQAPFGLDYTPTRLKAPGLGTSPAEQPRSAASEPEGYRARTADHTPGNSPSLKPESSLNGLPQPEICGYCQQVIPLIVPAVQAMGQLFHEDCLKCGKCQCRLIGKTYYNLKGIPHCDPCYQDTLEKCGKCGKKLVNEIMRALNMAFHPECFTCVVCHRPIGNERFGLNEANEIHCIRDFQRRYAPQCSVCNQPIMSETEAEECMNIELFDRHFHINCYKCEKCGILLSPDPTDEGCFPLGNQILCKTCNCQCARGEVPYS